jgi:hypothetical protein
MRHSYRRKMTVLTLLPVLGLGILLLSPAASRAQPQRPPIVERLAKTYGIDGVGKIEAIRYTFIAQAKGLHIARSWIWEPKTDRVTFTGKDKSGKPITVTYLRSQLGSQKADVQKTIDPGFWNDQYWLLLPLHAARDATAKVEDAGLQKLPLGKGSAEKIVVDYPSAGGYSPGDTWVLYVGKNGRVEQIAYQRRGPGGFDLAATWADQRRVGPLLISLDHHGKRNGQPVHIWFTNVAVRLVGSNAWIHAR